MTGGEILPDSDFIGAKYVDTITSEVQSVVIDSSRTSNIGQIMFGSFRDPEFGKLDADAYLQFLISGSSVNFGDPAKLGIDSLILSIDMSGVYGRYDQIQTLEIKEIDATGFTRDSIYYSNKTLPVKGAELSNQYKIDYSSFAGYFDLRIPLDTSLGNKLLFASVDSLNSNLLFLSFFNGLRIKASGYEGLGRENGAIFYIDAAPGGKTKLTLYYHEDTTHTSYDFKIADQCAKFTHLARTENQSTLLGYSLADPSGLGSSYGFIQDGSLIKSLVRFPGLSNLPKCIVHKASLTLSVDPGLLGSFNRLDPPTELYAYLSDSSGKKEDEDFNYNATSYNPITKTYVFDVTDAVMKIVNGNKNNNGFLLVPAFGGVIGRTMNRVIFGGPTHPNLKPVLKIVYSSLPGQ